MQSQTALADARTIGHADRRWHFEGLGLTAVIVVLAVIFTLINPRFATVANFTNILTQASFFIIIAVGMTFVITSAGIDLSVGSLLALVTVIGFDLIKGGMHPALGVAVMFALGGAIGGVTAPPDVQIDQDLPISARTWHARLLGPLHGSNPIEY